MPRELTERDLGTLADIRLSAELVVRRIAGRSKDDLIDDLELQDLVVHRLEIIGEAAKRLSSAAMEAVPEIDWKAIKGMRDRLIHAYDRVNPEIVWSAATQGAPQLLEAVSRVLDEHPPPAA